MKMASNLPSTASRTISGAGLAPGNLVVDDSAELASALHAALDHLVGLGDGIGRALAVRILLGDVDQGHLDRGIEKAHDGIEKVGRERAAVVGQKQPFDAVPAL